MTVIYDHFYFFYYFRNNIYVYLDEKENNRSG